MRDRPEGSHGSRTCLSGSAEAQESALRSEGSRGRAVSRFSRERFCWQGWCGCCDEPRIRGVSADGALLREGPGHGRRCDAQLQTPTSRPIVEFSTPGGARYAFTEDYVRLCRGRRSFCFVPSFEPGEQVPVVYNPRDPARAYIHDWVLLATVLTVFLEAGAALLLALMMVVLVRRRPIEATIRFGGADPRGE